MKHDLGLNQNVLELIGGTPMIKLNRITQKLRGVLHEIRRLQSRPLNQR